jgi:TetR/AcrR family fatty acid metabolism transcriptional regulator
MPRYKETERDRAQSESRQKLLEAALHEIAQQGFEKANINQISLSAGFAKGTIYNYFESKRMLMLELIDEISQGHFEFIKEQVLQEEGAVSRLERFFTAGFEWVADNLAGGLVMINSLYGPDAEFKQYLYYNYEPMFQLVEKEIIQFGIESGLFRQVDTAFTARLLMNLYLGIASQPSPEGKFWFDPKDVANFVLNALLEDQAQSPSGGKP